MDKHVSAGENLELGNKCFPQEKLRLNLSRSWQRQGERETLQREIHFLIFFFLLFTFIPAAKFPNPLERSMRTHE